jgi:hypothetical protein
MGHSVLEGHAMPEQVSSETILAVNIPEACRRISVGETLLREMMADGRLPFSRLPGSRPDSRGRIVIRVTDLDKLLIATRVDVRDNGAAFRVEALRPFPNLKEPSDRSHAAPTALGGTTPSRPNLSAPVRENDKDYLPAHPVKELDAQRDAAS